MIDYKELNVRVAALNYAYHTLGESLVSDAEYDELFNQLKAMEEKDPTLVTPSSVTQRVGDAPLATFKTFKHQTPMLSLANAMTEQAIIDAVTVMAKTLNVDARGLEFVQELKYDGLSCSLVYVKGHLKLALTRGDGENGEDVTAQVGTIKNIPLQLPELLTITVRGEVMMSKENFDRLNQAQVKAGGKLYANPRNAAAGSLRTHDIEATRSRELSFHAYAMMLNDAASLGISCQIDALSKLASLGFAVNQLVGRAYGLQQVLDNFNYIESIRKDLPIEIDGVVFKVNNFEHQRQLGWTSRTPKWAIACKFKPEEQETEIVEIVAQVGRTGVLTPVAYLTPVTVGGVVVSKATLHNQDQVNLKGIGAGDVVMVRRAGDVIPEIVRVTRKRYNGTVWQMPLSCPSCNSKVIQKPGGHFCSGVQHCPAQLLGKLSHYVGRAGMDIKGLGEHILDELVETKLVEKVSELYELIPEYQGLTIRSYSEKTWQGLLDSIEINGRRKPLRKFIYALGIPNVGEGTAKRLAQAFGTWSLFRAATFELLCAITDIGETTATSIMEAFESEEISKEMDITASFVQPLPDKQPDVGVLTGKTVVVTGAFETGTREDIHEMVERAGGTADGTVTSKTSYLVAGKNAGSKLAKAKELNVPILDEQAFIKLFN